MRNPQVHADAALAAAAATEAAAGANHAPPSSATVSSASAGMTSSSASIQRSITAQFSLSTSLRGATRSAPSCASRASNIFPQRQKCVYDLPQATSAARDGEGGSG